jgi:hypothetical protein
MWTALLEHSSSLLCCSQTAHLSWGVAIFLIWSFLQKYIIAYVIQKHFWIMQIKFHAQHRILWSSFCVQGLDFEPRYVQFGYFCISFPFLTSDKNKTSECEEFQTWPWLSCQLPVWVIIIISSSSGDLTVPPSPKNGLLHHCSGTYRPRRVCSWWR